jgi:nitronate monooxygenase
MWPDRRVIDLFGIEHPLILAPMTGVGTVNLAASVCAAGGLGSVSCATLQPERAAQTIRQLREMTDRPINVNFFCHVRAKSDTQRDQAWRERLSRYYRELGIDAELPRPRFDIAPFGAEMCGVVEATKPEVVSFHFGLPEPALLARVKSAGCRVMSSATTVDEARWLVAHGADVIIAQGNEAGGHRGMFLSPDPKTGIASQPGIFALVPLVADAVKVPVVAAGGIADARGIAAAFALGASGVQIGTGYLLCPEAATSNFHRDAIRHARVDSTVLSNLFTGRPARVLRATPCPQKPRKACSGRGDLQRERLPVFRGFVSLLTKNLTPWGCLQRTPAAVAVPAVPRPRLHERRVSSLNTTAWAQALKRS